MIRTYEECAYDTSKMIAYTTSELGVVIYASGDYRHFLVQAKDERTGVKLHRASEQEIRGFAERYGIRDLLRALPGARDAFAG